MARLCVACGLLLAILGAGFYNAHYFAQFSGEVTALLEEAQTEAGSERWDESEKLTRRAQSLWDEKALYLQITLRHSDTDAISISLLEALEYIAAQEFGEYASTNVRILTQLEMLRDAGQLSIQNLF